MGVERAVTRWYVQRQAILNEIASLEAIQASGGEAQAAKADVEGEENLSVEQRLAIAQEKLRNLGPCPKPMMG